MKRFIARHSGLVLCVSCIGGSAVAAELVIPAATGHADDPNVSQDRLFTRDNSFVCRDQPFPGPLIQGGFTGSGGFIGVGPRNWDTPIVLHEPFAGQITVTQTITGPSNVTSAAFAFNSTGALTSSTGPSTASPNVGTLAFGTLGTALVRSTMDNGGCVDSFKITWTTP